MEIGEIISDAIHYPLNHTKSLLVYIVIIFIMAVIAIVTGAGLVVGANADNIMGAGIIGIVGFILMMIVGLLLEGYGLDIIKFGIEKSDAAPEIDIGSQVIKGLKYLVVSIVYLIIPFIVMILLSAINDTLGAIVGIILFIIFGLALLMGECRLAKTGELGYALNIPEAIKDISDVGIIKVLAIIVIIAIIGAILSWISGIFANWGTIGGIISAILSAVLGAYTFFFSNRAMGLMYSDA